MASDIDENNLANLRRIRQEYSRPTNVSTSELLATLSGAIAIDQYLLSTPDPVIESNAHLLSLQAFKTVIARYKSSAQAASPVVLHDEELREITELSITQHVSWTNETVNGSIVANFAVTDEPRGAPTSGLSTLQISPKNIAYGEDQLTAQEIEEVSAKLAKILDKFVLPLSTIDTKFGEQLFHVVAQEEFSEVSRILPSPKVTTDEHSRKSYTISLIVQLRGGEVMRKAFTVDPVLVNLAQSKDMPSRPENVVFRLRNMQLVEKPLITIDSELDADQKARHETALQFTELLACVVHDALFDSTSAFEGFIRSCTDRYLSSQDNERRVSGTSEGNYLFSLKKISGPGRFVQLEPTAATLEALGLKCATSRWLICINSYKLAAVNPVVKFIEDAWLSGLCFREAWQQGATAADMVNEAIREGFLPDTLFGYSR